MLTLDIFKSDAFSMMSLTDAVNKIPYVPSTILNMGLFATQGVTTTSIEIEQRSGTLSLIPNTPRGAAANQNKHGRRSVRNFNIPHLPLEDAVLASEVQNIRGFGVTDLQAAKDVIDQRMAEMTYKHDATLEYGRIGAVRGIILDADGTTPIYNLFTEFGLSQTQIDFDLGTATTEQMPNVYAVDRAIKNALGQLAYTGVHAFCGKTFYERFTTHPKVKDAYNFWNAQLKSEDMRFKGFPFGGIYFTEYFGSVGGVSFVPDSEAYAFPLGVPGLFKTYFAPGNFWDTVNTTGLPRYARMEPMDYQRGFNLLTESNPLSLCTRPEVLIKLKTNT